MPPDPIMRRLRQRFEIDRRAGLRGRQAAPEGPPTCTALSVRPPPTPPPMRVTISPSESPIGTSISPRARPCRQREGLGARAAAVPTVRNASAQCLTIHGTIASVSTLLTRVGHARKPRSDG
jgi:hypothetical protein